MKLLLDTKPLLPAKEFLRRVVDDLDVARKAMLRHVEFGEELDRARGEGDADV